MIMEYTSLPKSGLKISRFCLGTMMFGGQTSEADALSIMDYAYEHGVNFFDTANTYTRGESERIVGMGLKGRRDAIVLATKVCNPTGKNMNDGGLSRRSILSCVDDSLKRLDTDYIDIYYMHRPDPLTDLEETLETMSGLVTAGKVRYIGVSNFAAWQIADMLHICDKRGYVAPVITQNVYNLLTRGLESELAPFLKAHKIGMAVYNPIAAGLLAGKHKPGTPAENTRFANERGYYQRYWSDENFDAIEKLTKAAEMCGLSLLELAFRWLRIQDTVTAVISGVSKLSQLEQNIALFDGNTLDAETLAVCDEVWQSLAGNRFAYNR